MIGAKLYSILTLTCPKCHKGNLFKYNAYNLKGFAEMNRRCSNCGQSFVLEPGFYYGAMYVSYGLTVALMLPLFYILKIVLGLPYIPALIILLVAQLILTPIEFRMARAIWLSVFVKYDPNKPRTDDPDKKK